MRILVAFASRHGSTQEIAERIGAVLSEVLVEHDPERQVDVLAVDAVHNVEDYDVVLVGSAIYLGRWLRPARRFLRASEAQLRQRPVWLFSSGPVEDSPSQAIELGELGKLFGARDHRVFGGRLRIADLGIAERTVLRAVHATDGDYRDWSEVTAWAAQIADELLESRTTSR